MSDNKSNPKDDITTAPESGTVESEMGINGVQQPIDQAIKNSKKARRRKQATETNDPDASTSQEEA